MRKYTNKEKEILLAAKNLFSTKGYKGTSMKMIADICGISKGTMYHYYKSKEALLINIIEYFTDQVENMLVDIKNETSLNSKEKLTRELIVIINHVIENQEFYRLQDQELRNFENKDIFHISQVKLIDIYKRIENSLIETYGEPIKPYVTDGAIILLGIARNYLELIMNSKQPLDVDHVIPFCIQQVEYFLTNQRSMENKPFLTRDFWSFSLIAESQNLAGPLDIIKELKMLVEIKDIFSKEFIESLSVIENELIKKNPNPTLIKGMLHYITSSDIQNEKALELKGTLHHILNPK